MGKILIACKDGQVVFQPLYYAGDSAAEFVDSAVRHLIRFGDRLDPLTDPLNRTLSIQDGYVSVEFLLTHDQVWTLQDVTSVGYGAQLTSSNAFVGFTVDTASGATEKIKSFLKNCS